MKGRFIVFAWDLGNEPGPGWDTVVGENGTGYGKAQFFETLEEARETGKKRG